MTGTKSQQEPEPQKLLKGVPSAKTAGSTFVLVIPLILIATLYGRPLERHYPILIPAIPYTLLLFAMLHATSVATQLSRLGVPTQLEKLENFLVISLVLSPLMTLVIAHQLIQMPIELIHVVKYGLLGFLFVFLQGSEARTLPAWRRGLIAFAAASVIGTAEECFQQFVPDRRFDPLDILLNVFSSACGAWYAFLVMLSESLYCRVRNL